MISYYLALIPAVLVVVAVALRIRKRHIINQRFAEIQNREDHFADVPADEASWDDAARAEARRFMQRLSGNSTWRYDHEVQGRMWRKLNGVTEYRPATHGEIEKARQDAVMQQW